MALHEGRGEGEEGAAAADLHLHRQRLALVQRHAAGGAHWLAAPRRRQALLVERVAGLVQDGEHRLQEVVFVVAGGDARVVGFAAAEGMVARVQAPALEVEAQRGHQCAAKRRLARIRERAFGFARRRITTNGAIDERRQGGGQFREDGIDALALEARFVLVEQRIVGVQTQSVAEGRGLLARQIDDGRQLVGDGWPVVLRPCRTPRLLASGACLGVRDCEIGRHRERPTALAFEKRDVGGLPRVEVFVPCRSQQVAGLRRRQQFPRRILQRRQGIGAHGPAAGGHRHRFVPGQHGQRMANVAKPLGALMQGAVAHRIVRLLPVWPSASSPVAVRERQLA